jgi:hypothetical protein
MHTIVSHTYVCYGSVAGKACFTIHLSEASSAGVSVLERGATSASYNTCSYMDMNIPEL